MEWFRMTGDGVRKSPGRLLQDLTNLVWTTEQWGGRASYFASGDDG